MTDVTAAWVDGRLVDAAEIPMVPVLSSAVFRGTSVFDVMPIVDIDSCQHAVGLAEHLARFERSMELMAMTPAFSRDELDAAVRSVVDPTTGIVRLVAFWAHSVGGRLDTATPSIVVTAEPAGGPPPTEVALRTARTKIDPSVLPPELKVAASYAPGLRAELAAQRAGFDGILNLTPDGDEMLEGLSASVAMLTGERWVLPPLDRVLDSISRRVVADVAESVGLTVEVRPVSVDEMWSADGLVLSSTTRPFVPISRVDDHAFTADTKALDQLRSSVRALLEGAHALSDRWVTPLR